MSEDEREASAAEKAAPRGKRRASQAAIDRATEDVERLEEVWDLETHADEIERPSLGAEEHELMADIDRVLPDDDAPPPGAH